MKKLLGIHKAISKHWVGDGFPVRTIFSYNSVPAPGISPFLMLDYAGPADFPPSSHPRGVGEHPHRGFETVTLLYQGEVEHRDSGGNSGRIGPGDVQWMTAASGVVHEEMHGQEFTRQGGTLEAAQLWVNLPRADKMVLPSYQEIPAERIPSAGTSDGSVDERVIAGHSLGASAVIETRTPIFYLDFNLKPGGQVVQPVGPAFNVFAYVLNGSLVFGDGAAPVSRGHMVSFEKGRDEVRIEAPRGNQTAARVLLIGGLPLNEPIARYGPFVMNTQKEIREAFEDYESGRMGTINF